MTVSPAAQLGWALVFTVTAHVQEIPSVWDTLVLVAPAGSRVRDEALGFQVGLWPATQALLCAPQGSSCSSLPYLHPCKLAFSSGLVLVSFSPLLIAHCRYLPALASRFWCPDLETPPPSWPVSTVALTKAEVDLRLPTCHVSPCFP